MTKAAVSTPESEAMQGIEYTIYTFEKLPNTGKNQAKWQKHTSSGEMQQTLQQAEQLFSGGKYQKIEVKQKYFDKKKNRNIDVTLRVFEKHKKRDINLAFILIFAVLCGAAAFGTTFYLTK